MQWLQNLADEIIARQPEGEVLVESGASPSGTYHIGHLREIITCDAIVLTLRQRGREARHIHFVDDLDGLRKIPINIPADYEQYMGKPLCDVPAPDSSGKSYGDYFLDGLLQSAAILGIELDVIHSHQKYRAGWFTTAIETALQHIPEARATLEKISGRQLDEHWSPIQIMEDGRLKNRHFVSLDTTSKTLMYEAADGTQKQVAYNDGQVKLDWRLDWPARWLQLNISAEPFGRDHASAGGSFDTGQALMREVYKGEPPIPVPYDFINRAGDTKKMSASKGTGIEALEAVHVLPPEVIRYFVLNAPPAKRLYFDQVDGTIKLVDEFAALSAKTDRTEAEEQLMFVCTRGLDHRTVSRVPFSHLVASYQAALKDADKTLDVMRRTEHAAVVNEDEAIIREELKFIDAWLQKWAPEDVKFELQQSLDISQFSDTEQAYLKALGDKIAAAPADADGEWFHKAIYEFKDATDLPAKDLFITLYRAIIGKTSGPRAGWFLSILPRDWLVRRLKLEE